MSLVDTQISIEYMFDKSRISSMIRKDIQDTPQILLLIDNCLKALSNIYLMGPHFRMKNEYLSVITIEDIEDVIYRILEVVMITPNTVTFSSLVGQSAGSLNQLQKLDAFKVTSSIISFMCFTGLLSLIRAGDSNTGMMEVRTKFLCDDKILKFIKQSMYLPPMICTPKKLIENTSCGYMTKPTESLILKSYNHHEGDICLDSLNKFNSVALSLDLKMLTTFDEQPKKVIDTHEKQKQFDKMREDSYDIYKLLIQTGNNFHLTHKVDKRGRTYAQGYHCSTQGNSFRKAIINLAKEEVVNGDFN